MKQILALMVFFSLICPQMSYSDDNITLKNPEQILDATEINKAIELMSKNVMECVNKKIAPAKECFCLYPEKIKNFNMTVSGILDKYPEWENKAINWKLKDDPVGYNLYISGLRKQLQMKCN